MSGTDYTITTNLQLFKPIYNMDPEQWGNHLNSNADKIDAQFGAGGVFVPFAGGTMTGPLVLAGINTAPTPVPGTNTQQLATTAFVAGGFLPLTGGTVTGPLTLSATFTVGGTTITGFGTAIGQALGPLVSSGGGNLPMLSTGDRLIFRRATPGPNDSEDFQFDRSTTYTGGAGGLNRVVGINFTVGPNSQASENGLIVTGNVGNTVGSGLIAHYGIWSEMHRLPGSTGHCTGMVANVIDQTGVSSLTANVANLCGMECDVYANNADDALNPGTFGGIGNRKLIHIGASFNNTSATPTEFSTGIWFTIGDSTGAGASVSQAIGFGPGSQVRNVIDTRGVVTPTGSPNPVSAVTMTAGHVVDFNGGTTLISAPRNYLAYDSSTSRLKYYVGGVAMWSVDASGNMRCAGTVTGSVTP